LSNASLFYETRPSSITPITWRVFLLALLALLPALAVYIDLAVLGQKTDEKSVTEISQADIEENFETAYLPLLTLIE
jgi:uncharacterized protein YpmS